MKKIKIMSVLFIMFMSTGCAELITVGLAISAGGAVYNKITGKQTLNTVTLAESDEPRREIRGVKYGEEKADSSSPV